MILTCKNTYWDSVNKGYKKYPSLNSNQNCDVVVIGGGISGCLTAYYLSQYNIDTILLEKDLIAHGNTAANPCILQYDAGIELQKLVELLGKEQAILLYRLYQKSIDDIENIVYNIRQYCDFKRLDSIYLCNDSETKDSFKKEFQLRKELSLDIEYMGEEEIKNKLSISYPYGIYSKNYDCVLDPFKFSHALLKAASLKNAKIYENTSAISYDYYSKNLRINTNKGSHIFCKKIVFASNHTAYNLIKDNSLIKYRTTYSIATKPIPNYTSWYNSCLLREANAPHFYIRPSTDNRILAGSFDYSHVFTSNLENKALSILEKVKTLLQYNEDLKIDYFWSTNLIDTKDTLPYIGEHPKFPKCYFNIGFNQNEICHNLIGAQIIKDLILYNNHPYADIFGFDRIKV